MPESATSRRAPGIAMEPAAAEFDALNAYETRIALMVVAGESNRRVADLLGVSSRAVEHHLTSVYRKLGISGRPQLRAALRRRTGRRPGVYSSGRAGRRPAVGR